MVRQKVKGTGHKQPTDIASEPNFYAMPAVTPIPTTDSSLVYETTVATSSYPSTMQEHQQKQQLIEEDDQEYNSLMNSPGLGAAALLNRLSSVGTYSLDENNINPPPLVLGTGATETTGQSGPGIMYTLDYIRSNNLAGAPTPYTPMDLGIVNLETNAAPACMEQEDEDENNTVDEKLIVKI